MVLDNYPAHPYVELAFLPSNTTSKTPPMDAGVIRNFKLHSRCMLANRQLQAVESNKEFKWSLLDGLSAVKSAWSLVTLTTIANCYHKAGFVVCYAEELPIEQSSGPQVASMPESELGRFRNTCDELNDVIGELPTLEEYVDIDVDVDCTC